MTPELQQKIAIWRAKIADNTITEAEMQEAVIALREGRMNAAKASDTSRRAKVKAAIPNADDLLNELGG